jgi:hypothetical protein
MMALDHLVVAAATLAEGRAWARERLGTALDEGGRHATFGTQNALLSLGPDCYLEVIAVDGDAPVPTRPRWFELDTDAMRARLTEGPALVHWVVRVDSEAMIDDPVELSRGANRWVIGVPPDGRMPLGGLAPSRILWRTPPPSTLLPDRGVRLELLELTSPDQEALRRAVDGVSGPVSVWAGPAALVATLVTPSGRAVISG